MKLKEQLQFYLREKGMNASQLARKSKVPKTSLSDWLGGATPRKLHHLKQVADCFQITIDHLCFGEGHPTQDPTPTLNHHQWQEGLFEIKYRKVPKNPEPQ